MAAGRAGRPGEGRRAGPPILVTGVPRSGTTWLARTLAASPGTAMPGREPMNPRGRQYALGGTLTAWTRLESPTPAQVRALRRCYAGLEPRTFSRYGIRQWAAPLPETRVVVKDPFALLAVETVHRVTGAVPVVVYRPAGAVLASYRRMGWRPDVEEVVALGAPPPAGEGDVAAMAAFWSFLHAEALAALDRAGCGLVVAHDELLAGGEAAVGVLRSALGLRPPRRQAAPAPARTERAAGLHDFDRAPEELAEGWRRELAPGEAEAIAEATAAVAGQLAARRLRVLGEPR